MTVGDKGYAQRPEPATPTEDTVLEVDGLQVAFPSEDGLVRAVRGVSYRLERGAGLGIVGESGSGKSVTALAVMGLLPAAAKVTGSVRYRGSELLGLSDTRLSDIRGSGIAMIFQDPMTSLNPVHTVGAQIIEGLLRHNPDMSKRAARDRAVELLGTVGIPHPDRRADSYPHELSGGMRQRVVIAIAMANDPAVIIADEPTTALDVTVQAQVLEALETAREETGAALVLITHDLGVVAGHTDRVAVMYAGRVVESGTVEELFYEPRMPYTLGLLGSMPRMDRDDDRLTPIAGSPPSLLNLPPGCPFAPRCPMREDRCDRDEPSLHVVDAGGHRSACHFADRLVGMEAGAVFEATGADNESLARLARSDSEASSEASFEASSETAAEATAESESANDMNGSTDGTYGKGSR
ncbi:ABC transporter ATP-binding protein [Streptomyces beihaiensis]|uniref:ABC transporter ATP-binding protein n=1 Tax=Streptomyces beihaiensis TaxID=2984495 RepID=A0ABT3TYU1_9ACTN|nr:ABC transporter ATP-binding protein [Streptomyces beihaiensis]MCX3062214.1 ABC transporter ATP-binding protein [Streptomyces beihaiensis]